MVFKRVGDSLVKVDKKGRPVFPPVKDLKQKTDNIVKGLGMKPWSEIAEAEKPKRRKS